MSLTRISLSLVVLTLVLATASGVRAQRYQPFVDPGEFDIDFQMFGPADTSTYGNGPQPNTGFFFTYDRCYWAVTRPDQVEVYPHSMDFTWGNRLDMGYMTEERCGWLATVLHIDGPNLDDPEGLGGYGLNDGDLSSFEINRVWRTRPFHNGGYLEPFVGFRYSVWRDRFDPDIPIANNMVLGQVGSRIFKKQGRWLLSGQVTGFVGENFQYFSNNSDNEVVPGADLRAEAAFEVTRDVAVRFGWEMIYMGNGVARGPLASSFDGDNQQDLLMHGLTFGITFNR